MDGPETLFRLLKIIEHERQSNCTKMNDRSSKSHCTMDINVYTKFENGKVRVNYMRFLDMAGSERVYETSTKVEDNFKAIMVNWGLLIF